MSGAGIQTILTWLAIGLLPLITGIIFFRKGVHTQSTNQKRLQEIQQAIAAGDPTADEYETQAELHRLEMELRLKTPVYTNPQFHMNAAECSSFIGCFLILAGGFTLGFPFLMILFVMQK